jgi:ribosomal protein S18 acetylase RimI-like enzyme
MIELRPATYDDVPRLRAIAQAAYATYLPRLPAGVRPAPMDADYAAALARARVDVAEHDGALAGFVVTVPEDGHLLLENLAVDPVHQGHGVGRVLLTHVREQAVRGGLAAVRLYTHEVMVENQRLYGSLGYVETGRRREDGLDRVFYELRL